MNYYGFYKETQWANLHGIITSIHGCMKLALYHVLFTNSLECRSFQIRHGIYTVNYYIRGIPAK